MSPVCAEGNVVDLPLCHACSLSPRGGNNVSRPDTFSTLPSVPSFCLYNTRAGAYYYRELSICLFNSAHFNFNLPVKQRKDDSQHWWWCHWGGKGQGVLTEEHFGYSVKALCEHLHVSRIGPAVCFLGPRHRLWTSAEGFEPQLFEIKTLLWELVVITLPSAMSLLTSFQPMAQLWC